MRTIYKYPLQITDSQIVELPHKARILSLLVTSKDTHPINCYNAQFWLYAEIPDTSSGMFEDRYVYCVGTGNPMPDCIPDDCTFLGTVHASPHVWHFYVRNP